MRIEPGKRENCRGFQAPSFGERTFDEQRMEGWILIVVDAPPQQYCSRPFLFPPFLPC